ncbi:MAG: hypothetical protein SH821_00230 [Phototrophicales bacterium]|mgnify:CR=1 FL=1|nr:hypothetical protein [Phototrophicales bacterium]
MKMIILIGIIIMVLTGCEWSSEQAESLTLALTNSAPTVTEVSVPTVKFAIGNISLSLPYPKDWESYTTQYGVVLAEYLGSVATEGQLGGILIHLFVPPLEGVNLSIADETNRAYDILTEILAHPDYVGDATVSAPAPFMWDELDCAYYLMDNGEGNLTIVIGILDPTSNQLVTVSVSAPANEEARIREGLPVLLNDLVINNHTLSGAVLEQILPKQLIFPRHSQASLSPPMNRIFAIHPFML